jgi:PKD repeat protein
MVKNFTRFVIGGLLFWCCLLGGLQVFGQTVTIRNVDPGPYGIGSTIAAEITVDETGGNIGLTNRYNLYLSDANGSFASQTLIGSLTGFYSGFVNGIIPNNIPAGTGYRVRVQSTAPVFVSAPSAPFTVNAVTGVQAQAASTSTSSASEDVFGTCVGQNGNQFTLTSTLAATHTVTATLYNDMTRQSEGGTITINTIGQRTPSLSTSSYTVLIKAVNADGTIGTKAYLLINNIINIIFGAQNSGSKCLLAGEAQVTYNVDISTQAGIQRNYPGSIYTVNWGDGTSQNFSLKQIQAVGGLLTHSYRASSCGARNAQGSITNQFQVRFSVTNPYCPPPSNADNPNTITTNQTVLLPPTNNISGPQFICLGTEATFLNASYPGQTITTGNTPGCAFNNASYTWSVDGVVKATGKRLTEGFKWTFTTRGSHTVTVELENPQSDCPPTPFTKSVCVQEPPRPAFDLDAARCTTDGPVLAVDRSVLDLGCNDNYTYAWTVTPSAGVTYANGTNAANRAPQFVFANTGIYNVYLEITNSSCGTFKSLVKQIVITSTPVATLSADFSLCGKGQTLTFDNTTGSTTRTVLTGTANPQANTYQWTVVGQSGIAPATFANGTTANSQYPQISFPDFGTYDVTVTHINNCGSTTSNTQHITFKEAPTVLAGPDQVICPGTTAQLDGQVIGTYNTRAWSTSGTGTFSDNNAEKPIYTPSAADRAAGTVTLTLSITTSLPGDCATISDQVKLTINPTNTVTTAGTKTICTGNPVGYSPASTVAGSTFNWVVTANSPTASGFTSSGTGDILDVLTNSSTTANATVTYTITPRANDCDGTPFNLTVTVVPKPQITLTGPAANTVCNGSAAGIQLRSNVTGTQYTWTVAINGGITGAAEQATPVAATTINQILTNTSSTPATVTYTVKPVNSNSTDLCEGLPQTITITVQPQVPVANAGTDAVLCNQPAFQLQGNDPGANFTGTWTVTSGQTGVTFTNANQFTTTANGLQPSQVYTFRWTITGAAQCTAQFDEVQVANNPPITNNIAALTNPTTCAGQNVTITGSTPTGGSGAYTFVWESSADGNTWSTLSNQTAKDLNIVVTESTYFRRSVNSGACTEDKSNAVRAIVQPAISGNTIAGGPYNVCVNKSAGQITGSTPAGADGNFSYQWQSSTDGGTTWNNINGATQINYTTPVLIADIQYRRVVSSLLCNGVQSNYSNIAIVKVNPDAKAEFTWTTDAGCVPFVISPQNVKAIPYPDRNDVYTWYANNQVIGTGITFPGYTVTVDGESVEIKLIVTSKFGCESEVFTHSFTTTKQVKASFTPNITQYCGNSTITFVNTSTPLNGGAYIWNFGNGQFSNQTQPAPVTFAADDVDGTDKTYKVSLMATTTCSIDSMVINVTVKPTKPIPRIAARSASGCAPFNLVVDNITPGNNDQYRYHLVDAAGNDVVVRTVNNKTQQSILISNEGTYSVYLEAINTYCNTSGKSALRTIQVTSRTVGAGINTPNPSADRIGCAPYAVTFLNESQGASSYLYDWGDGTSLPTNSKNPLLHTYQNAGKYTVKLHAINACGEDIDSLVITVKAKPAPAFSPDNVSGCNTLTVNFTNTTPVEPGSQASDYLYSWNFGDAGSTTGNPNTSELRTPPAHTFSYMGSPYTVSLTVTSRATGCFETTTRIITVNAPAIANFRVRPDSVITYPNYSFSFEDQSTNAPRTWRWTFGDGSGSTLQNPTHTYADTGTYKVTLLATNQFCGTTKVHYVRITGTPGQLYLPNAFTPASTNLELQTFKAKGSGLREWHMRVFNNYGQLVWETTRLDARGEPVDGWDGTFQGTLVPQGVYIWQVEASFINGNEWKGMSYNGSSPKRTGVIHLIR